MNEQEWKKYKKKPNIVEIREVDQYEHYVRIGDTLRQCIRGKHYIMRGEDGELNPIDKKIFHEAYEMVDEDESDRISELLQKIIDFEKKIDESGKKLQDLVDRMANWPKFELKTKEKSKIIQDFLDEAEQKKNEENK